MANGQAKNKQSANRAAPEERQWKKDVDSPIEQAKMHPTIKKMSYSLLTIGLFCHIFMLCYIKAGWFHGDNTLFDSLVFALPVIIPFIIMSIISMVPTRMEE